MPDNETLILGITCDEAYKKMEAEIRLLLLYNTPFRLARVVETAGDHQRAVARYHTALYGSPS